MVKTSKDPILDMLDSSGCPVVHEFKDYRVLVSRTSCHQAIEVPFMGSNLPEFGNLDRAESSWPRKGVTFEQFKTSNCTHILIVFDMSTMSVTASTSCCLFRNGSNFPCPIHSQIIAATWIQSWERPGDVLSSERSARSHETTQ